jgi:hypothetical protein
MPLTDCSSRNNTVYRPNRWGPPPLPPSQAVGRSSQSARKDSQKPSSFVSARSHRYDVTKARSSAQSSRSNRHRRKQQERSSRKTATQRLTTENPDSHSRGPYWAFPRHVNCEERHKSYSTWDKKKPLRVSSQIPSESTPSISPSPRGTPEHTVSSLTRLYAVTPAPHIESEDRHDSPLDAQSTLYNSGDLDTTLQQEQQETDKSAPAQSCSSFTARLP